VIFGSPIPSCEDRLGLVDSTAVPTAGSTLRHLHKGLGLRAAVTNAAHGTTNYK
jgi:hypothetical protein